MPSTTFEAGAVPERSATRRPAVTSSVRRSPLVGEELGIESILHELAQLASRRGVERIAEDGVHEVLLDREVDGIRCVVLRATAATNQLPLSPREQEIARMVARGYPNKTIAAVLDISTWTVSTHLRRMFAKLGVTSRAAMVARSYGLADEGSSAHVEALHDPRGDGRSAAGSHAPRITGGAGNGSGI